MDRTYLIPANTKRSMLIFGIFQPIDLIIFAIGLSITFIFLMIFPLTSAIVSVLAISPALVAGFLVLPIPNYYNVRTFLMEAWRFYTIRQKFIWKGWCVLSETEYESEK